MQPQRKREIAGAGILKQRLHGVRCHPAPESRPDSDERVLPVLSAHSMTLAFRINDGQHVERIDAGVQRQKEYDSTAPSTRNFHPRRQNGSG